MKLNLRNPLSLAPLGLAALLWSTAPVDAQTLGGASSSAIVANTGVTAAGAAGTVVNGEVSSSPTASISGFPPAVVLAPFTIHRTNDAYAVAATAAVNALFTELGAGACTSNPGPQMASATFTPGIHCFAAAADLSALSTVTLNGSGTYIFRVGTALTANVGSNVILQGGANACNVFWRMGTESATLNGLNFPGNVIAQASVTLGTGMNLTGRALARNGAVTMAGANTVGGCSSAPPPPPCPAITLSPSSLPNGTVGIAYLQTITGNGGVAPYTFTLASGALPGGLTLTPGGAIAGTPITAGSFTFGIRGADANGCFTTVNYTIVIAAAPVPPPGCPVITIAPLTIPNGTVGAAYSQTISASGGAAPYSFGVTTGALPAGLTLTPAGILAGTPTSAASSSFTIRGTDANGCFADRAFILVIAAAPVPPPVCPTILIDPPSLPSGTVAVAYDQTISASGGTAPYSFGLSAGALPLGLNLSPAGVLTGTPTTAGTANFTVRGTDASGCFADRAYALIIAAAPPPPPGCPVVSISPATLPNGMVAVAYSQTLTASGGAAPYSFGITAGAVPTGMSLTPLGVLVGTPTGAGSSSFTVRATDANGCFAERPYTLVIAPAPPPPPGCPVVLLTPATLPPGALGVAYSQTLSATGGTAPYSFGVTVGALPSGLLLGPTGVISGTPRVAGTSSFTIRATDANGCFREVAYSINIPGPPVVPTLSEWAMLALIAMLGLAGYQALRSQTQA